MSLIRSFLILWGRASGAPGFGLVACVLFGPSFAAAQSFSLDVTTDVMSAQPGGEIMVAAVITNNTASTAVGLRIDNPIPNAATYVPGSATATNPTIAFDETANAIRWNGDVPAGGTVMISFSLMADAELLCGTDIVEAIELQDAAMATIETARVVVSFPCPDLILGTSANVTTAETGDTIRYSLLLENNGAVSALGLTLSNPIPESIVYVNGSLVSSAPGASFDEEANAIVWRGGIPPRGSVMVAFSTQVLGEDVCVRNIMSEASVFAPGDVLVQTAEETVVNPPCPEQPDAGMPDAGMMDAGAGGSPGTPDAGQPVDPGNNSGGGCSVTQHRSKTSIGMIAGVWLFAIAAARLRWNARISI